MFLDGSDEMFENISSSFSAISFAFLVIFFHKLIHDPDHLKGKPDSSKMKLIMFSSFFRSISLFSSYWDQYRAVDLISMWLIYEVFIIGALYFMYFGDDSSGSCCLNFKPWKHEIDQFNDQPILVKLVKQLQDRNNTPDQDLNLNYDSKYSTKINFPLKSPSSPPPQYSSVTYNNDSDNNIGKLVQFSVNEEKEIV